MARLTDLTGKAPNRSLALFIFTLYAGNGGTAARSALPSGAKRDVGPRKMKKAAYAAWWSVNKGPAISRQSHPGHRARAGAGSWQQRPRWPDCFWSGGFRHSWSSPQVGLLYLVSGCCIKLWTSGVGRRGRGDASLTTVPLAYGNETGCSQGGAQVGHRWLFPIAAIGYWRVGGYAMRTLRTAGC